MSALLVVVFSGTRQHGNFIGARVVLLSVEVTDILQPNCGARCQTAKQALSKVFHLRGPVCQSRDAVQVDGF